MEEEDLQTEAWLRTRNLMWTVSGNYSLDTETELSFYERAGEISLYDAVKEGAFARFFDEDAFGMYLIKKIYAGADEAQLRALAQLCVDAASYPKIASERPGVPALREKAFSELLDLSFASMSQTLPGRLKIAYMRAELTGEKNSERQIREALPVLFGLKNAQDTMDLIRSADQLYNSLIDRGFEKKHGDLDQVLRIPVEELREFDWKEFLDEESAGDLLDAYFQKMSQEVFSLAEEPDEEKKKKKAKHRVVLIDEAAAAKMYSYMELNFGRSYLTKEEQARANRRLCRGAHADCSLYFTDGILGNPVIKNAQYVNAKRTAEKNRVYFRNHSQLLNSSVRELSQELRRALNRRREPELCLSDAGRIVPRRLWQVGRVQAPSRLFEKTERANNADFVIDLLIDASGSQRDRAREVALQAFLIAEACSLCRIPLQITGFCTFWDYTVLQRFRAYDAPRRENRKLLNFVTTANNRDGLAIRAVGDSLLQRPEEGRILIVASDGKPNDIIVNRPDSRNPETYAGDYAVRDTAYEVRRLRSSGVHVLGIFTGKEKELAAEKTIFGRDFTYIREISGFAHVVSGYLYRLLDEENGE